MASGPGNGLYWQGFKLASNTFRYRKFPSKKFMCIISSTRTREKVKIKDISIKFFYKFFLIIKSWCICCSLHIKSLIKPPATISQRHKRAKTVLFDFTTPWKLLIFIIRLFRGETDQLSGATFRLSSVVKFGQTLPIGSTHFGFFYWFPLRSITYVTILQFWKKSLKLLHIALLGPYLGKN